MPQLDLDKIYNIFACDFCHIFPDCSWFWIGGKGGFYDKSGMSVAVGCNVCFYGHACGMQH